MTNMQQVIEPRSDQLNADSLIAGPKTITITDVHIKSGQDQPVTIRYEGDDGKPWKPCKSMSRVLVAVWGPDAAKYVGKSATLYRDPKVKWGGMEVGGIRISHMSHIERDMVLALTVTKGKREHTTIKPLVLSKDRSPDRDAAEKWANDQIQAVENATTLDGLNELATAANAGIERLKKAFPDLHKKVDDAIRTGRIDLEPNENRKQEDAPYAEWVENIRQRVAEAKTVTAVNGIEEEIAGDLAQLPGDVADGIKSDIDSKKEELK